MAAYPDILFYESMEGTLNADKPDIARSLISGAIRNNDTAPVGSYSLDIPTTYDRCAYTVTSNDIIVGSVGNLGFYIYRTHTTGSGNGGIFSFFVDNYNKIDVYWQSSDSTRITFYYKSGTSGLNNSMVINCTVQIPLNTWTFIQCYWDSPNNSYGVIVGENAPQTDSSNLPDWVGTSGTLTFGDNGGVDVDYHLDQMLVSNLKTRDLYAIRDLTSFPDEEAGGISIPRYGFINISAGGIGIN